ncbi:phenylacetate--CoA ligase family protein [Polaribacter sp. MSW13]|uniref:Phenylacetate--CoA ligase family protein n=1 Tax=Polaribacter marinus TaxID=2916838 RepID=A0A9X2AIS8_9FLAO|nr:phenylacetate--CoA ligase family protein [Polaribacter marinus]MCI2228402.1 phenylacetate--CoA ligase family protein [Polaribacter marinus]
MLEKKQNRLAGKKIKLNGYRFLNNMLRKFIYLLGQNIRNPSLKKHFYFLKKSENWSLEELENYQFKKLKELLLVANEHSEFYKNKFIEFDLDVNKISKLSDIKSIPILTKSELLSNSKSIHTNLKFKKTFLATTSGTSGKTLKFNREETADSFNRAAIQRGYSWFNIQPWFRNGYFWGFNFSFIQKIKNNFLDFLQNRYRIFSYEENEIKNFIKQTKNASFISGYSSMIYQTAVYLNKSTLEKPKKLKMVKGTSEKVLNIYQEEVKKAFGVKMISEYGATEAGIIAFECTEGNMHINMEGVLVEEIDQEILVTNLQMQSFPIIRYKLGDYVTLAPRSKKCSCGKSHLIIDEVTGRVGKSIYGKTNIYPSLYFYYIFKNLGNTFQIFLNYQVIQEKKGKLTFLIEQELSKYELEQLNTEILKYFKEDIFYNIIPNSDFKKTKGKLKNFISLIDE